MAEILFGDYRLQAWRPELDLVRWKNLLESVGGKIPHALLRFADEIHSGLSGFVAELRIDQDRQILRPYRYDLPQIDAAVANRQQETADSADIHRRTKATVVGINKTHDHFRSYGSGAQAILISPVNEATGQPEFLHTAIYFLTYTSGAVSGWQLFVDFSKAQRQNYMAWVSRRAAADYPAADDLELAASPVLSESSGKPIYTSVKDFVADIADFLKSRRDRVSISGISLDDPAEFVESQLRLEAKNRQEAETWVEPYIRAIAQGSIELGRRIITNLQLKVLGLTESAVRAAARLASVDFSALQVFLRACGFLSFTFSPEASIISSQSFSAIPAIGGLCQEKICRRCGIHAGDNDTKCPSCGWSP